MLYHLRDRQGWEEPRVRDRIAASYQEAIVDALVERCEKALRGERCLAAVGGVSLNSRLRTRLTELAAGLRIDLVLPEPAYCTDNAAMIAGLAGAGGGLSGPEALEIDAEPNLGIGNG